MWEICTLGKTIKFIFHVRKLYLQAVFLIRACLVRNFYRVCVVATVWLVQKAAPKNCKFQQTMLLYVMY